MYGIEIFFIINQDQTWIKMNIVKTSLFGVKYLNYKRVNKKNYLMK